MSAKDVSVKSCLGLLKKLETFEKIPEGANNLQKPANIPAVIDGLNLRLKFKSIQSHVYQSILKPWSHCQQTFIALLHQDDAFSKVNLLFTLCAVAYDKGETACLEEIADKCLQDYIGGIGHMMNNLGVMFSERMEYKRSEICFVRAKSCFEDECDHLGNAVATLNLAILHKLVGDYQSAVSCCDAAASLCHDVSIKWMEDVDLPWKLLTRVAGLCQEFGNYKRYRDILHIGVSYAISGASEASQVNLTKQLMTLQLKEQNGKKIKHEELEDFASCLFLLLDQSCTENPPKPELINADFITIVMTVAKMYRDIDHLEEACKLLEKLETTFLLVHVHDRKHSLYGSLLYQIGSFKLCAGNAVEAVKTLKQAEEILIHYCGRSHHMVASCKSLLGTCALVKGQTREAATQLNEALILFKKINHHHPEEAEILLKLAFLSSEEGNFKSARTMVQKAVDIFTSFCGEVSPKTGRAYFQAAAILQKARESRASAVDYARKAIDIFLQLGLRSDHPDVKTCHGLLGVLLLSLGQCEEAEEQFSEVQQQVPLQGEPCLTAKIVVPENTNMFFQVKTADCGTARYMGSCLGAQVVSLVNLVDMKNGEERRNHLNTLLSCLQGNETKEPLILDFAGQTVCYLSHKLWVSGRCVHCIVTSAALPDCCQTDQGMNADFASLKSENSKHPNVFLLSPSNGHGRRPCSLLLLKFPKVLEMKELSSVGSADFCESVMLFLQPNFKKCCNTEGQDLYMELTLPKGSFASFSLCAQIDYLPLLVEQKLSVSHKECGSTNSVIHSSLVSVFKPSTHVSHLSYRFSSQHQAEFVFDHLMVSLYHSFALTKVEGPEISNAAAVPNGAFFLYLKPSYSSLSVVVEKESVLLTCRTVNEFESTCICSLVRNTVEGTMESLGRLVKVVCEPSTQLPCDDVGGDNMKESLNSSCGCEDFRREATSSGHSLETLGLCADVRSQEPESDHLDRKPSAGQVSQNERRKDILFASYPDDKASTDVCLSLLECLLTNRHVSSEVQPTDTGEILSTDSVCLDDNMQHLNDAETTETVQLANGTGLSEEETQIRKNEVAFSQNQCHKLRQQINGLKEQLQQCEAEKQQLELELGKKLFLEDKQKRSEKILLPCRGHVSEQSRSCTASGASYAFTRMEGKLLCWASPQKEPGFSLQGRLLEISNALSEAELKQMKFLARPKVYAFRLKKIREGFKLFEELETNGELSCTYVRELLKGIQRFDLLQKLDRCMPLLDNAESGQKQDSEVNADNNGPEENHSTVASLGGECSASENMVLSKTDSTQGYKQDPEDGSKAHDSEPHFTVHGASLGNTPQIQMQESPGQGHCTNRSIKGSSSIRKREDRSSSSDRSEVDKMNSSTRKTSVSMSAWERSGARPKDRAPMQSVPGEWSVTEQVQQDPSDESLLLGAEASRGVDCSFKESPGQSQSTNRSSSSLDRSEMDKVNSSKRNCSASVSGSERLGERPKDRAPMERAPGEWPRVEQVQQEPPDESLLPGADTSRVADSASTITYQPLVVRRWERFVLSTLNGGAEQLDASTGGICHEDEECLPAVALPSATLPTSLDDCISESLGTTNNSCFAAREGIARPRVIQGIARVTAQIQREREEQERSIRSICPHRGLIPRL